MTDLDTAARQPRSGHTDLPTFLEEPRTGMLEVARDLYVNPASVVLPDGRTLGYAETGDPDGTPILGFHGGLSNRLGAAAFDQIGREMGIRFIAPERPGIGVSDPDPDFSITDWPADVAGLLDALDIDEAPVLGISAGGPFALVCGAIAPERFPRVAVCSSLGPVESADLKNRLLMLAAIYLPWLVRRFLGREVSSAENAPEKTIERRIKYTAPADEPVWRSDFGKLLIAGQSASVQNHGLDPFVREIELFGRDWGFTLQDIDVPVGIWHGEADRVNPVEMARYLQHAIPTAEVHYSPDLGHVGTIVENEGAILKWLTQ